MKKLISTMAVAALLFAGLTSCAKEGNTQEPSYDGTGNLKVSFGLVGSNEGGNSRAMTVSSAKPTTDWANLNGKMMILFVDNGGNTVRWAKDITVPASGAATTMTQTFNDVPAKAAPGWDMYVVGNYPATWNANTMAGKALDGDLKIKLETNSAYTGSPLLSENPGSTGYSQAPEIFVARQEDIIIADGETKNISTTNPFNLRRAVSLARIRIDVGNSINKDVKFATSVFAIRRAAHTFAANGEYTYVNGSPSVVGTKVPGTYTPAAVLATDVFYTTGALQTGIPATGYNGGSSLMNDDVDAWGDYLIWPGGGLNNSESAKRFDIVIAGTAPQGYLSSEGTTTQNATTLVYWTGAVNMTIGPNQIMELLLELKTAGSIEPPVVGAFANLTVGVELLPWGDIIPVPMPL